MEDAAANSNRLPQINKSRINDVNNFKASALLLDEINEQDTDRDKVIIVPSNPSIGFEDQKNRTTGGGPLLPRDASMNATMEMSHLMLLNESQSIEELPV